MQKRVSVKGNVIKYYSNSLEKKIEEILDSRFDDLSDLHKNFDDLYDPYLLKDMDKAVERIKKAKENGERVIIFGDYDVDGITSTSVLVHFLKTIGMLVSYRLPHRVNDGYGLKNYFIDELNEIGVNLIITVDCGSRDLEVIKYAKNLGIDIIITDHHIVPEIISEDAIAIINPKRLDCNYPYKDLAGVGVAFKLMSALAKEYFSEKEYRHYLKESIDLVAIGTVADCMPLTGENRIFVKEGLKQIKKSRSKGIRSLIEDKINEDLDADIFSFLIGPKLNSAGRMDSPYKAVNLILNSGDSLGKILKEIEGLNDKRKYLTQEFTLDALNKINRKDNVIFYISPAINHGIIGIVAGRITEQFYKPCIVLKDEGDKLVASCRSPGYFSIIDILEKYKDSFEAFGGHNEAAGFTIKKENFMDFKISITKEMNKLDFSEYKKQIDVDKIVKLDEIGFNFLEQANKYKPFGIGNPKPLFIVENLEYSKLEFLGQARDHIKFTTKHGFKIFGFNMGEHYEKIKKSKRVDLIFDISEDNWMGNKNLMLKIIDMILE